MNNRLYFSNKRNSKQVVGQHRAEMMAQYRKQLIKCRDNRFSIATGCESHNASMIPTLLQVSAYTMEQISQLQLKQHSSKQRFWHITFLVLILFPIIVQAMKSPITNQKLNGIKIDRKNIQLLPLEAMCSNKTKGFSNGIVCQFDGKTHYMKSIPGTTFDLRENNAQSRVSQFSYEEFNRQFVSGNIGIRVPASRFFEVESKPYQHEYYIATEEIDNLSLPSYSDNLEIKLGAEGIAKLAVANMFIRDLHKGNFGYDNNGLIVIDADSIHIIPRSIDDYLQMESTSRSRIKLNIYCVRKMIKILEKMRETPLPDYHEQWGLTRDLYLNLLEIYITAYSDTIYFIQKSYPRLSLHKQDKLIKDALIIHMQEAKNRLTNQYNKM